MGLKELLEKRKLIKRKKPDFIRSGAHKKKGLERKWIRPKGLQSKLRLRRKGRRKVVTPGYGSPRAVRGKENQGKEVVLLRSPRLDSIDPKTQAIIISSSIGKRKKIAILKETLEKGIYVINIRDPQLFINKTEEDMKKKKEEKEARKKKKEEKKKKKKAEEEKKKEEKDIEKTVSEEERKEMEKEKKEEKKKEKDKILTKKT